MSLYNPEGIPPLLTSGVARIERSLPFPGDVLVRAGERVEPGDPVARALVPAAPQVINVSEELGTPPSRAHRLLRKKAGDSVAKDEELARFNLRSCIAPTAGVISVVDTATGYVTIEPEPISLELVAALRGIAMEVQPYRGVIIETPAMQVYGAFGVGQERSGVLRLLLTDTHDIVTPDLIDARSTYSILVCNGAGITAAALRRAVEAEVRGVLIGSIDEAELRAFLNWSGREIWSTGRGSWRLPDPELCDDPGITVIITEGFGQRPMSPVLFDMLGTKDREEAFIDGTTQLRSPMTRPRVIVPLTRSSSDVEPERPQMKPGVLVRILDQAHLGEVATVRTVSRLPVRLASGVRSAAVQVQLVDDHLLWLPISTVEVLGE